MGDERADEPVGGSARIRTFLIADVRGYTLFTQERGDEGRGQARGTLRRDRPRGGR